MSYSLRNAQRCKSLFIRGFNKSLFADNLDACVVPAWEVGDFLTSRVTRSIPAASRSYRGLAPLDQRSMGIEHGNSSHRYLQSKSNLPSPKSPKSLDPNVFNVANGLSMARLLSGPLIASWILHEQWSLAVPGLIISGATDWLDGHVARRNGRVNNNILGSYLDPLADKVLIGCVVGALGYGGALPGPLVAVILARDGFLIAGAFVVRAKSLQWRWPGIAEFFRISSSASPTQSSINHKEFRGSTRAVVSPPPALRPLMISKVNTALQLALVGSCMLDAWVGWPGQDIVWSVGAATAGTTILSCAAYVRAFANGQLLR